MTAITLKVTLLLTISVGMTFAQPLKASAEPSETEMRKAEALATEAKVFFRSGLFQEAATQFMEAFALSQRPALVYNAARAYEEGGFHNKSIALFSHYIQLPGVDKAGRSAATKRREKLQRIVDAERIKAAKEAKKAEDAKKARAARERKRQRANAARAQADKRRREAIAQDAAKNRRLHRADTTSLTRTEPLIPLKWRLIGAGGALIVAGGSYAYALNLATEMPLSDVHNNEDKRRYLDLESSSRLWRGVAVGSAVVAVGLGAWMTWDLWLAPAPEGSRVSFAPLLYPEIKGGFLTVTF